MTNVGSGRINLFVNFVHRFVFLNIFCIWRINFAEMNKLSGLNVKDRNVLINPAHPEFSDIRTSLHEPVFWDRRLFGV